MIRKILSELCNDWYLGCWPRGDKTSKEVLDKALKEIREIIVAERDFILGTLTPYGDGFVDGWNDAIDKIADMFK